MSIEYLDRDEYWRATIYWNPANKWYRDDDDVGVDLAEATKHLSGIYRFESRKKRHGEIQRQLLYIGITYEQDFDERLHQGYHEGKLERLRSGEIWVSVGIIDLRGSNRSRKRYEEIEQILIYFTDPILNKSKTSCVPECWYEIINEGYKGLLPWKIKFPVAEVVK
jgi:hypothetical protein